MRYAGEIEVEVTEGDDAAARKSLYGYAMAPLLESIAHMAGREMKLRLMFEAEVK